ncbi:unnamed protein product [Sphagnum balticum]
MADTKLSSRTVLNLNVGCLGHVDSGKTSLVKALSTTASTASFDKSRQSRERGITIDLGFSSLCVDIPEHIKLETQSTQEYKDVSLLQFTFVDCPGHASLIKTIIGGAQIIDYMLLVVDIVKGIQTQTAECLVIGEMTCDKMIVVLNKCDLIPLDKREVTIEKMSKRILKTLEKTKFASSKIIPVAAKPDSDEQSQPIGLKVLLEALCDEAFVPKRNHVGELMLSVDHCFSIRGQGAIMTGTILQGTIQVNDTIEIPSLKVTKKVKSMQMFHKPIMKAIQGDRVGVCVTQFDPKLMERGFVCSPGYMNVSYAAIASFKRISYFKGHYKTRSKFHVTLMHETVLAKTTFFASKVNGKDDGQSASFDFDSHYYYVDDIKPQEDTLNGDQIFVLLQFEHPVILNKNALYIGSKLDSDINANVCRLAFHGNILESFSDKSYMDKDLPNLKIYKIKEKEGIVDRVVNEYEVIARNMFKKETKIQLFEGLKVKLSSGEEGIIDGNFGTSGKVKIRIPAGLKDTNVKEMIGKSKRTANSENEIHEHIKIYLRFKRFIFDENKRMIQE